MPRHPKRIPKPNPPPAEHPLTKESGVNPNLRYSPPNRNKPTFNGWWTGKITTVLENPANINGNVCDHEVEQLTEEEKLIYTPRERTLNCRSVSQANLENESLNYFKTGVEEGAINTGKWTKVSDLAPHEKFKETTCNLANTQLGGDFTWWGKNGWEVATTIKDHKGTQGMMDAPIKMPNKSTARDKLGPATYSVNYKWNESTGKCERAVKSSAWLRDAMACTGNIGSSCDLGYTASKEVTEMYEKYITDTQGKNTTNQAMVDFFNAAMPSVWEKEKTAQDCGYDGWWDRKICGTEKGFEVLGEVVSDTVSFAGEKVGGVYDAITDNFTLLIVGGVIVVFMIFK